MWNDPLLDFAAALKMRFAELTEDEVRRQMPRLEAMLRARPALDEFLRTVMDRFEYNLWSGWMSRTFAEVTVERCRVHQFLLLAQAADHLIRLRGDERFSPGRADMPPVSIIIPAWNQWEFTRATLLTLFSKTVWPEYEVIVIDNGSDDETPKGLALYAGSEPRLRVIRNNRNLGFSGANNQGAEAANHERLIFLNNDILIHHPDWIGQMMRTFLSHPRIGATGEMAVLDCFEGDRENYYQKVFFPGYAIPVSWISGYNLLTTKRALRDAGGWRGDLYGPAGYEDIHLGYALREAGWLCVSPVEIPHIQHLIGKTRFTDAGRAFVASHSPSEDKHQIFCKFFGSRQFRPAA